MKIWDIIPRIIQKLSGRPRRIPEIEMNDSRYKLPDTVLWSLLIAAPIPFLLFLYSFVSRMQNLSDIEEEMERIHLKASHALEIQRRESSLMASLQHPDPHYLEKNMESLTFLLPELKKIESLPLDNSEDEYSGTRVQFLKGGGNRLIFSEEQTRTSETFRETEEKQQHPVEMNEEDLKKLLCLIEGITIWPYGPKEGRPQLIIKDFILTKKEIAPQEKVFVISTQLIKRENPEAAL